MERGPLQKVIILNLVKQKEKRLEKYLAQLTIRKREHTEEDMALTCKTFIWKTRLLIV